jgi:energy-coupling factor transporter ATP-binding protein EcfA2
MEEPAVIRSAGGYTLSWKDAKIGMRADRMNSKNESITAEMTIWTTNSNNSGHLHIGRLNLTSTRERHGLTKRMTERWETVDWDALIEQACLKILTDYRKGEPTIILADHAHQDVTDLLHPFLLVSQPSILYGPGGSGKSMFATYLALLASSGHKEAVTGLKCEQTNTLYLDWEAGPDEIVSRLHSLSAGLGITPPREHLRYRRCTQTLSHEAETIQALIMEHSIGLVIVDSVGLACGGEPEKAEVVLDYFRALRSLNCSTLSIDHISKATEGKHATPFGSVYKQNMARSVWECKKGEAADDNASAVGLFHRKANFGRLSRPKGYQFCFEPKRISVVRTEITDDPELSGHMTVKDRLYKALSDGKKTAKQLSDDLGIPASSVRVNLNRFKSKLFIQLGNEWGLCGREDDSVTL